MSFSLSSSSIYKPTYFSDRYGTSNSCIQILDYYLNAPSDIYFSDEFSITAWINIQSLQSATKWQISLLDFGNGFSKTDDDVFLEIENGEMKGFISRGTSEPMSISANSSLIQFNKWYHVAFVVENSIGCLYLNGKLAANQSINMPNQILRKLNFIGKSDMNTNLKVILDDLKIFQGALQPEEVRIDHNSGKIYYFIVKK